MPTFAASVRRFFVLFLGVLLLAGPPARASLLISVYHDNTLYLGGDSLASILVDTNIPDFTVRKFFKVSDSCCVGIVGFGSFTVWDNRGRPLTLNLPNSLEKICVDHAADSAFLDQKIDTIAAALNQECGSYFSNINTLGRTNFSHDRAFLQFYGRDPVSRHCFIKSCWIDGATPPELKSVKEFDRPGDSIPINLCGEPNFMRALVIQRKSDLMDLTSSDFKKTLNALPKTDQLSDVAIKKFILEMFELNQAHTLSLGYGGGHTGPPYRIVKISATAVTELTPDALPVESTPLVVAPYVEITNSPPTIDHTADDAAITAVMQKLGATFITNDYTCAFQVLYTPILDGLGGPSGGLEAAKNLTAQMEQQQIVTLSWTAKKPYSYVPGHDHTYAVIPYESTLTIAGKKARQTGYQLGIKTADSPWQFVTGDNLTVDIYKKFFPDFPRTTKLPKFQRRLE